MRVFSQAELPNTHKAPRCQ